jgi:hypothetical protein
LRKTFASIAINKNRGGGCSQPRTYKIVAEVAYNRHPYKIVAEVAHNQALIKIVAEVAHNQALIKIVAEVAHNRRPYGRNRNENPNTLE